MIEFCVDSEPRAKQSFRVTGRGRGFTPARIKAWQSEVGWAAQKAMRDGGLYEPITKVLSLAVELNFYLGNRRRIDLDNLSKAVLDGLNGIAWEDDQQVVDLHLVKKIDKDNPHVHVVIGTVAEMEGRAKIMMGPLYSLVG